jgi:transketolase
MPNVQVIRPADGNETSAAWIQALETNKYRLYQFEAPDLFKKFDR